MAKRTSNSLEITIQRVMKSSKIPNALEIKSWIKVALEGDISRVEMTVRFVDSPEGQALNAQYRHKDFATNVLSFNYQSPKEQRETRILLGDLVLCVPVVLAEAKQLQKSAREHFAHLIIHGTLHLLGYNHERNLAATRMESKEILFMQQLGFSNPYT